VCPNGHTPIESLLLAAGKGGKGDPADLGEDPSTLFGAVELDLGDLRLDFPLQMRKLFQALLDLQDLLFEAFDLFLGSLDVLHHLLGLFPLPGNQSAELHEDVDLGRLSARIEMDADIDVDLLVLFDIVKPSHQPAYNPGIFPTARLP